MSTPEQSALLPFVQSVDISTVLLTELDDPGFTNRWRRLIDENPTFAQEILLGIHRRLRANEINVTPKESIRFAMFVLGALEAALARRSATSVDDDAGDQRL